MLIVEVEDHNDEEAGPASPTSPIPAVSIATEAAGVDRADSSEWQKVKADSDWVVAVSKTGKAITLLATRVRKRKEERLSLRLKNPKGERVPYSLRSQRVPPSLF